MKKENVLAPNHRQHLTSDADIKKIKEELLMKIKLLDEEQCREILQQFGLRQ